MREIHKPDGRIMKLLPPQTPLEGVAYVPSQFVLAFEHKGKQYAFNTLTKQCLETAVPSSAKAGGEHDQLIRVRFLVPNDKDECDVYNSISAIMRQIRAKTAVPSYVIMTTLYCNARCVYCYEEGMKQADMTDETAEETLRFILDDCAGKDVSITWFGGEPLLRESVMDRISQGLLDAGVGYSSVISTNGSLITPRTVEKMAMLWNVKQVNVSMDGSENDYIARKAYTSYRDYYHSVIRAVDEIAGAGISVSLRCNVDLDNIDGVPSFINDLSAEIKNKSKVWVYLSPLYQVRQSNNDIEMMRKYLEMKKVVDSAGFDTIPYEWIDLSFRSLHCMADGRGIAIGPDGSIYCCELMVPGSLIGKVRDGVIDKEARARFGNVTVTRDKCRKCAFLPECTSLSTCPRYFTHCKEIRAMLDTVDLKRLVDAAESAEAEERSSAARDDL